MKILLFGSTGLVGSEFRELLEKVRKINLVAPQHNEVDVSNKKALQEVFETTKPDFVINTVGYTNVDAAEDDAHRVYDLNAYAVANMAQLAKEHKAPLLHFSTDYVFNGENKDGYTENAEYDPINFYGKSKSEGEKLIKQEMENYYIVRSSWIFGKNGKNFPDTIIQAARDGKELKVVNDQFGTPTYAKDLAEACIKIFIQTEERPNSGIYHITNEGQTNWFEVAKAALKEAGINYPVAEITSKELERKAKRPHYALLVNTKLPHLRSWREALHDYITNNI